MDDELIQRIQNGDQQAFAQLYDAYSSNLYGLALTLLNDEDQAADVLQSSFVKIWRKIKTFDQAKGSIFTWMLKITRNTAIDELRKLARMRNHNDQLSTNIHETSFNINTDTIGIREILNQLNPDQKLMVEYLYFKGYTQQEVSDELNIPLGTVKTRIRSSIHKLKELLLSLLFGY